MVDIVSIVVAVVSLIGSLVAAAFTGWITYYVDEVKRRAEAKKLTSKYQDPLTLSANELQSRFYGLADTRLLTYLEDEEKKDLVSEYTCFLIGQYFSWVYIFRREAQFLQFSTDKKNRALSIMMNKITKEFAAEIEGQPALMLWRGQQMAIGEVMTKTEANGQMYCMGYAEFAAKYRHEEDKSFRRWFHSIDSSISLLAEAKQAGNREAENRVRRLQHLLVDLVLLLDEQIIKSSGFPQAKAKHSEKPACKCEKCPGQVVAPAEVPKSGFRWHNKELRSPTDKS